MGTRKELSSRYFTLPQNLKRMKGKPLKFLTWNEVEEQMSIAGEADKARKFGEQVYELASKTVDVNNIPSIDNQIFALQRVIAELQGWRKTLYRRQHP